MQFFSVPFAVSLQQHGPGSAPGSGWHGRGMLQRSGGGGQAAGFEGGLAAAVERAGGAAMNAAGPRGTAKQQLLRRGTRGEASCCRRPGRGSGAAGAVHGVRRSLHTVQRRQAGGHGAARGPGRRAAAGTLLPRCGRLQRSAARVVPSAAATAIQIEPRPRCSAPRPAAAGRDQAAAAVYLCCPTNPLPPPIFSLIPPDFCPSRRSQGKIKSLEQIYLFSLPVKEYQIVDFFLGGSLKDEVGGGQMG